MEIIVQLRKYPFTKGTKNASKGLLIKDKNLSAAVAKIKALYNELEENSDPTITFHR